MKDRFIWTVRSILAACLFFGGQPVRQAWAGNPPTVQDIIEGIEESERLFFENESLLLRYERTKTEDLIRNMASGGFPLAEWTMAFRGDKWFVERRYIQPGKANGLNLPAKPETQVLKDHFIVEWRQYADLAVVDHFDLGRNLYAGLSYTRNLSLDAPRRIAQSGGGDIEAIRKTPAYADYCDLPFLPEFLRTNKSRYQVLANPEEVDGVPCWVVEWPGMDRLWVDPRRGFSIPRRAYCWGPGKPLKLELRHKDYREVKPGLWLPFIQIEDQYASIVAERQSLWGRVAARSEYRLHAIEFDRLPDNFFDLRLPPGTRVLDSVRQR